MLIYVTKTGSRSIVCWWH